MKTIVYRTIVLAQLATIVLTWDLWKQRITPPLLPVFDSLPQTSVGPLLVIVLIVSLFTTRLGTISYLLVLIYAFLTDQTRLQPEFVSMALLLISIEFEFARFIGRAHLITLWVWSGIHKILSHSFETNLTWISEWINIPTPALRWIIRIMEVSLGVAAITYRTRKFAILMAICLHGGILILLIGNNWNSAVWPWNIALPAASVFLLNESKGYKFTNNFQKLNMQTQTHALAALIWIIAWIYPAGFYIGISNAYMSHNLYSDNTKTAFVCEVNVDQDRKCFNLSSETYEVINVPLPPESYIFKSQFNRSCKPNETLFIYPIRTIFNTEDSSSAEKYSSFPCNKT